MLTFRLTSSEADALFRVARRRGVTASDLLRAHVRALVRAREPVTE